MVAVAADHLPQLRDTILHDVGSGFGAHSLEGSGTPGWNFFLNENAAPISSNRVYAGPAANGLG